jgi:hypothetical protein
MNKIGKILQSESKSVVMSQFLENVHWNDQKLVRMSKKERGGTQITNNSDEMI